MNKEQWRNFKKNNLKLTWRNATASWCKTLPYKLQLIDFLKENEEFVTKFYDIGDGISVSFRKNDENVKSID